jgi:hypothetical protein
MKPAVAAAVLAGALAGCAGIVSTGTSTVDSLELEAPRFGVRADGYRLLDAQRLPVSSAFAADGRIRFDLPVDRSVGRCVAVVDRAGESVLEGGRTILLALRAEYEQLGSRRETLQAERDVAAAAEREARESIRSTERRLESNRGHEGGACRLPAIRALPPRPVVRCRTHDECLGDGAAICFTRYLGPTGCSRAREEYGRHGLLARSGCAVAAAKLAGREHEPGAAVVDALHRAAADAARELSRGDDRFGRMLGSLLADTGDALRLERARSCTRAFAERHHAPLASWLTEIGRINGEPAQVLSACRDDISRLTDLRHEATVGAARTQDAAARLATIDRRLAALREQRRPVEWCPTSIAGDRDRR